MSKKNATIYAVCENGMLQFYMNTNAGREFLFSQRPYDGVKKYFRNGIAEPQLRKHKYGSDKMVDHVVRKLPKYISYVKRYAAA